MFQIGTATTVEEAIALEKSGVDAIVAQGSEAGGHRGTFGGDFTAGMVGVISLVPQVVDAVRVPVIASGGHYGRSRRRGPRFALNAPPPCRWAPRPFSLLRKRRFRCLQGMQSCARAKIKLESLARSPAVPHGELRIAS